MSKLSFIGDLTVDVYPKLKKQELGGASLISALWAKKLGAEVTILAAVGNDEAGKSYQEFFKKNRLSPTFLTFLNIPTSQIEIFLDSNGERSFGEWQPGAFAKYHLGKKEKKFLLTQDAIVLPLYFKTRHLLKEILNFQFSILNQSQISNDKSPIQPLTTNHQPLIIVDFDDLSQFGKKTMIIEKHLSLIDIVKVGLDIDKDKALISRFYALSFISPKFPKFPKIFLITLGPNGSLAFINGKTYHQKSLKVKKVVNATGAGDAFLAGFLVEFLHSPISLNPLNSLKTGNQIASQAISQPRTF